MAVALDIRRLASVAGPSEVSTAAEIAETVRNEALTLAYKGFADGPADGNLQKLLACPAFANHVKYRLAIAIANVLGTYDRRVLSVYYVYNTAPDPDAEVDPEAPGDPLLHFLVLVTSPTAALQAFVKALDRALVQSLHQLPSPALASLSTILDVSVVTEDESGRGTGWAALLQSAFAPPVQLWKREP
jgi:hypothetical protein